MTLVSQLVKVGIVDGLCICGNDTRNKIKTARVLIPLAKTMKSLSIVTTKYPLDRALNTYGQANVFVINNGKTINCIDNNIFYLLSVDNLDQKGYLKLKLKEKDE